MRLNRYCPTDEGWGPWSLARELDLTPCFEHGVMTPVLNMLFVGLALYRLKRLQVLYALPNFYTKTWVYWVKLALASAIASAAAAELLFTATMSPLSGLFNVFTIGQLIQTTAYVVAIRLHYYEQTRAHKSSGILLLFWLATILMSLVTLRTDHGARYPPFMIYSSVRVMRYAMLLCVTSLFCVELWPRKLSEYVLAEDGDGDGDVVSASRFGVRAPKDDANIFSQLTFSWLSPLFKMGQSKQITEDDLWEMPSSCLPTNIAQIFGTNWQHELNQRVHRTPSLLRALWRTAGPYFILGGVFKLMQDILTLLKPVLLSLLLGFVASHTTDSPKPMSYGYFYACCMLVLQNIQTIVLHQSLQVGTDTGLKVRSSLTTAIYRKAMRLSNETRQEYTTGNISTLYSVDVDRIGAVTDYAHILWSGPLQISMVVYMLYNTLGWSVFAGVAIMVVSIPLNGWISRRMRVLQSEQMKNKDKRTTMISEVLSGVRVIKLYAWERSFISRIQHVRESLELVSLSKYGRMIALTSVSMTTVPFLVSFTTFLIYSVFDGASRGPLTAQLVFVSLALFNLLRFPLTMIPIVISTIVNANVAMGRVHKLLTSDELDLESVTRLESVRRSNRGPSSQGSSDNDGNDDKDVAVQVANGSFRWSSKDSALLDNINFSALSGEHLAIVGRVGSGKSSLLSALLGDMRKEKGKVVLCGQVAYIPQQPWIMNATLRSNVLFGLKYDEAFYNRVIDACALRPDLDMLTAGDMTEIGEKGINLSGGQKARVSLARAVYARADIYILDDPLSAVDAHVARHLFDRVLGPAGLLKSRCRIHATNAIQFIGKCDSVLMLQDGLVAEYGAVNDLMEKRSLVYSLIQEYGVSEPASLAASRQITPSGSTVNLATAQMACDIGDGNIQRRRSTLNSMPPTSIAPAHCAGQLRSTADSGQGTLIMKEVSAVGKVSIATYMDYFRASTWSSWALFAAGMTLSQGFLVLSNIWLKVWSSANDTRMRDGTPESHGVLYYIAIYGMLGLISAVFSYTQSIVLWSVCAVRCGRATHRNMLDAVLRSPMGFFDTTPLGRVLQRFSKDQTSVDEVIPRTFGSWLQNLVSIVFSLAVIMYLMPAFGLMIIPTVLFFFYLKNHFLDTSRMLKRLLSTTRSPIYSSFEETLAGVSTIRAFGKSDSFIAENLQRLTANHRCAYLLLAMNRWLAIRQEIVSALIIFVTAMLGVISLLYGKADVGVIGLSLSYALQNTQQINWMLRMEGDLENSMCDYVRVQEYEQLTPEAPDIIEDNRPERSWPEQGMVEFKNYSTRYREGLDLVLKDVSFAVKSREKVGIVGRTGAGKSSLTLALFRIIEAAEGQILLDGEDIAQYGLFDVRSKLSIIPQDPVLFAGTVRENLDPFNTYSDQDIWRALEHARLADFVRTKDERLEFVVTQGGENFSVGQRQLICLARALLKHAKVLVLDEATAAIDPESDAIIQDSIRKEFKDCTVLTIAHRLNTIIDSDRILVLDAGQVAEFDTPDALLAMEDGLFKQLWARANEN